VPVTKLKLPLAPQPMVGHTHRVKAVPRAWWLLPLVVSAAAAHRVTDAMTLQSEADKLTPIDTHWELDGVRYRILGWQPPGTGHPIFLHAGGSGEEIRTSTTEYQNFTRQMARRGFLSVAVGLPGQVVDDAPDTYDRDAAVTLRCNNNEHSLLNVSRDVFTYRGPGDNESTSALATICRLERADCSAGIALHGASLGALLGTLAPRFAVGITASLMWSAGVYVAGGLSCCGLFNATSCCSSGPDVVMGGEMMACLVDDPKSVLPSNRRRRIIAAGDFYYGDCVCPHASGPFAECTCEQGREGAIAPGAVVQSALLSGYDCGGATDCIQPDGSGYYVPSVEEVGGNPQHSMNNHVFWAILATPASRRRPGENPNNMLNPNFVETRAPWGLKSSFDWLTRTARRKL